MSLFNKIKILLFLLLLKSKIYSSDELSFKNLSEYNFLKNTNITREQICRKLLKSHNSLLIDLKSRNKKKIYNHIRTDFFQMSNSLINFDLDERVNFTYSHYISIWKYLKKELPYLIRAVENNKIKECSNSNYNNSNDYYYYYTVYSKNTTYQISLIYIYDMEKWKIQSIDIFQAR
jgi:hypothetical protein